MVGSTGDLHAQTSWLLTKNCFMMESMVRCVVLVVLASALGVGGCGSKKPAAEPDRLALAPPARVAPEGGAVAKPQQGPTSDAAVQAESGASRPAASQEVRRAQAPPSRQTPPKPPPGEERIALRYSAAGTTIEVAGACLITEDSVRCWDARGQTSAALRARVESALTDPRYGNQAIRIHYKAKNRLVVMKTTRAPNSGSGTDVHVAGFGDFQGSAGFLMMPEDPQSFSPQAVHTQYQGHFVAASVGDKTTRARIVVTDHGPTQARLDAKAGATLSEGGVTVRIRTLRKATEVEKRTLVYANIANPFWIVEVEVKQSSGRPARVILFPIGKDGHPIQYVDGKGGPVDPARQRAEMEEMVRKGEPIKSSFRSANMNAMGYSEGATTFFLRVDPGFVDAFEWAIYQSKTVDITGILLDPK